MSNHIRNFCIIAHIDHGKSTLADRLLQLTGTISEREMMEQVLDTMDLEREKGVTIKASAVRMLYGAKDGEEYQLNLIDTPGHVDFSYEVSRALAACEGALLVVDASQGMEAQTLANLYLALEADLEIIPVINKIDLDSAQPDEVAEELSALLGTPSNEILRISAKEGTNVETVLEAIVKQVSPPAGDANKPLRALIFDSHYDSYKGVVAYVRLVEGHIHYQDELHMMATESDLKPVEIGIFGPDMQAIKSLTAGEVGYVATGLKNIGESRVGDTITLKNNPAAEALPGYQQVKPMVFAGIYPVEGEDYDDLKDAMEKLQLNDASLIYEPETSQALNFGFRCGFLGMFHMEIIQERLEREENADLIQTAPNVTYEVRVKEGGSTEVRRIDNPAKLPDDHLIQEWREPIIRADIVVPVESIGNVMKLCEERRGRFIRTDYISTNRVIIHYRLPFAEIVYDFYDRLKSITRGYGTLDYRIEGYRPSKLVRLRIMVNNLEVDALSTIVHRDAAERKGRKIIRTLGQEIPRHLFAIALQASIGGRVIAREDIRPLAKNVTAKCYGGDITRK
ncbi:MAG: elongation factor 4, partial [Chloroflexi bacterium]|nr:elongation factor 4 [Chloroflexota bacterium]